MNLLEAPIVAKLIALALPIVLLLLTAVAGVAYSHILSLSLPISKALGLFTVVLPLITGLSTHGTAVLVQRASKKEQSHLTLPFLAIVGFQLIYETVVATLAVTHIIPPSALKCGLETKWEDLFKSKNDGAIRAIQESLQCCGFNTVKDRAWPWPTLDGNGHTVPSRCAEYSDRAKSCFGDWRKAEQINAGLLLSVAVAVFIIKVWSVISLLTNTTWAQPTWARASRQIANGDTNDSDEDSRAQVRRLIEHGNPVEEYHDEPVEQSPRALESIQGPRVEPSHLAVPNNVWHE